MAQEINRWTGEETFKDRCHLKTMGTTLLKKHGLGVAFFYTREGLNKRSGYGSDTIYVAVRADDNFYDIRTRLIGNVRTSFRISYTIERDVEYGDIAHRMAVDNNEWWVRTSNVPKIRDKITLDRENARRELDRVRNYQAQSRWARNVERQQPRPQEPREEDLNDAFARGQAELRREREMMAEFVAPHPGAQLDLVSTPVEFVPEQPPNA